MDRLGLVNKRLIAVHMTQLEDDEIATLAAKGGHVVHCPSSNLKLASGTRTSAVASARVTTVVWLWGGGLDGRPPCMSWHAVETAFFSKILPAARQCLP